MSILAFGINYTKAPIEFREQVAFMKEELGHALESFIEWPGVNEAVLISTCNRTEVYCQADTDIAVDAWLAGYKQVDLLGLQKCHYYYQGLDAAEHLLRVVCGLDSMVLGEPQILGQVKANFAEACLQGTVGQTLSQLFRQAFSVAKKVRTCTSIGACPVSVASTAIELIRTKSLGVDISEANIVLVGAGDTIKRVLQHVVAFNPQSIAIVSRHFDSADKLCGRYPAKAYSLDRLGELMIDADIVFSATASAEPVITRETVRNNKKQLAIVDIAVPRDVDREVAQLEHVQLFNIDDLRAVIKGSINAREHAAMQAKEMIVEKAREFMLSLRSLEATPMIKRFRSHIERLCEAELVKAMQNYEQGESPDEVLKQMSRSVANKLMHAPCMTMKQASSEGRPEVLKAAHELFGMIEG